MACTFTGYSMKTSPETNGTRWLRPSRMYAFPSAYTPMLNALRMLHESYGQSVRLTIRATHHDRLGFLTALQLAEIYQLYVPPFWQVVTEEDYHSRGLRLSMRSPRQ